MNEIRKSCFTEEDIKAWLVEFREREKDIRSQTSRLDVIETRLYSIGSPSLSDMPKGPMQTDDKSSYMVAVKIDLENDISSSRQDQERTRKLVENIIKGLKKSEERSVIRARYLDCAFYHEDRLSDWSDVNFSVFGDREDFTDKEESYLRRVHKIHSKALFDIAQYAEKNNIRDIPKS